MSRISSRTLVSESLTTFGGAFFKEERPVFGFLQGLIRSPKVRGDFSRKSLVKLVTQISAGGGCTSAAEDAGCVTAARGSRGAFGARSPDPVFHKPLAILTGIESGQKVGLDLHHIKAGQAYSPGGACDRSIFFHIPVQDIGQEDLRLHVDAR
jgi:hypothetical protein